MIMLNASFANVYLVGIISFSITRLKHPLPPYLKIQQNRWNHKFLDYEIETEKGASCASETSKLES